MKTNRVVLIAFVLVLCFGQVFAGFKLNNPNATDAAKQVYHYLCTRNSFDENRVLSGQNCRHGNEVVDGYPVLVEALYDQTGKYPAFVGIDYEYTNQFTVQQLSEANAVLIDHWNDGGLVTINWAPYNPWTQNYCRDQDQVDLNELVDPGSAVFPVWRAALDRIAEGLSELQDAGVVVVWRPLQEVNGDWFWWGTAPHLHDDKPFKNLWRDMYNYFTHEKGLNNLIWELSVVEYFLAGHDLEWYYPGDDVVDMIGNSVYKTVFANNNYRPMLAFGKPIAACETGPDHCCMDGTWDNMTVINNIRDYSPNTVYFHHWHDWPDHFVAIVSNQNAQQLMDDPWVITRDEVNWLPDDSNQLPEVTVNMPLDVEVRKGDNLPMTAEASDADGQVVKVQFCDGYEILGEDDSAPYEFEYRDVPAGTLHLNARAIDDKGGVTVSSFMNIPSAETEDNSANLIANGQFDQALGSWNHWGNDGTDFAVISDSDYKLSGRHSARAEVTDGGSSAWMCQFSTSFVLENESEYSVSFKAVANERCNIVVMFQKAASPYTEFWRKTITVDETPKSYGPFTYKCKIDEAGAQFKWWMGAIKNKVVWVDSVVVIDESKSGVSAGETLNATTFALYQNYPNPFNPETTIRFEIPKQTEVRLQVFDVQGRLISTLIDFVCEAGGHSVPFSTGDLPSGTYLYRIEAGEFSEIRKMVLLR